MGYLARNPIGAGAPRLGHVRGPCRWTRRIACVHGKAQAHVLMIHSMDLGLSVATAADSWKVVRRAEALGYTRAWFYDTQMLNADVLVAMGAAAVKTTKIRLATGVLIPSNRIAPVAANALASLNALAPGRIDFGISTGFTARRSLGLGLVKLADMKEYIRIVRGLLAGETLEWTFENERRKIRFLNPEIGVIKTDDPIPLHISAVGPKARALTAELDAHWIFTAGNQAASTAAMEAMSAARRSAGRDPARYISTAQVGGCVLADGETYESPRVQVQAGPHATIALHNMVEAEQFGNFGRGLPPILSHSLSSTAKYTSSTNRLMHAIFRITADILCSCDPRKKRSAHPNSSAPPR
ncbi:MAG: LLM class flavin-dependent oxidoreductase [Betaproteobacteria bacterium]|nr:LLM class flavin-dependent oxidoreductase [Betaproteobacteria bacterium]